MNKLYKKNDPLFAIYKNGLHLGNTRAGSTIKAIHSYLFDSGYSPNDFLNTGLTQQYKAEVAKKDIHY
jgi:hypothetical protein